ncbi:MAG: type II secretion system protein M [Magnetococcales bacterium]|nr:type II secretion system protein M [Magnetococcales bacterium]
MLDELWNRLNPAERGWTPLMAAGSGALLLALLLAVLAWESRIAALEEQASTQTRVVAWMQEAAQEATQLRSTLPPTGEIAQGQTLMAVAERTIRSSGLEKNLTRVEPGEQNTVRVSFDAVGFDRLIHWLNQLQREFGVEAARISIKRDEAHVGMVSARLTLSTVSAPGGS